MDILFEIIVGLFTIAVTTVALAFLDAAIANWLLHSLFPQFGYWAWFRISIVLAGIVVSGVQISNTSKD